MAVGWVSIGRLSWAMENAIKPYLPKGKDVSCAINSNGSGILFMKDEKNPEDVYVFYKFQNEDELDNFLEDLQRGKVKFKNVNNKPAIEQVKRFPKHNPKEIRIKFDPNDIDDNDNKFFD